MACCLTVVGKVSSLGISVNLLLCSHCLVEAVTWNLDSECRKLFFGNMAGLTLRAL